MMSIDQGKKNADLKICIRLFFLSVQSMLGREKEKEDI